MEPLIRLELIHRLQGCTHRRMEVPLEPNRNRIDGHKSTANTQLTVRLWMATLLLLLPSDLLCELA